MSLQSTQFFSYKHLPDHLQEISKPFTELAEKLDKLLPENPEKSAMMRKLMEAKDCAVRANIWKSEKQLKEEFTFESK